MDYIVSEANKKIDGGNTPIPAQNSYTVRVNVDALNIRAGAGTNYAINGCIRDRGIYTIVETQGNWGRLKSGAGWICLVYTQKTSNTTPNRKSNEEIAREVIRGDWGNGDERRTRLINAGYDYNAIQAIVNKLM